MYVVKYKLMRI